MHFQIKLPFTMPSPSHPTLGKEKLSNAQGRGKIDRLEIDKVIRWRCIKGTKAFAQSGFVSSLEAPNGFFILIKII